jgi:CHAT domain-containing protein
MAMGGRRVLLSWLVATAGISMLAPGVAFSQTPAFKAPPRTIADITAILDQEKPDPEKVAKFRAQIAAQPPAGADEKELMDFYFERAIAFSSLGRLNDSIEDSRKALEIARKLGEDAGYRIAQHLAREYRVSGDHAAALEFQEQMNKEFAGPGRVGRLFNGNRLILTSSLRLGMLDRAENVLRRTQALYEKSKSWPKVEGFRPNWASNIEEMQGKIADTRGRYPEAEAYYRKAIEFWEQSMQTAYSGPNPPRRGQMEQNLDFLLASAGRAKLLQGKFVEAEADLRRALLSRLRANGKFHSDTAQFASLLSRVIIEQGRYEDAEKLTNTSLEIYKGLGYGDDSPPVVAVRDQLAAVYSLQRRHADVLKVFEEIDRGITNWPERRKEVYLYSRTRVSSLLYVGRTEEGTKVAREFWQRARARYGDQHNNAALARGMYAIGLFRSNQLKESLDHFRASIPILIGASRESDDEDVGASAAREQRMRNVVGTYIALLARAPELAGGAEKVAEESFPLAEVLRGRTVQKALAASSARASARDPALAELVRLEQDLEKQVSAQLGMITDMLSLPPEQRNEQELKDLRTASDALRKERANARRDIEKKFPQYAELIDPKAPTIAGIRAVLKPDEVFMSFYFGNQSAYVWAIPKTGKPGFSALPLRVDDLEKHVIQLRKALEPQAASIDEIPAFDLKLAHELYSTLLKPVEEVWKPGKSLIIVTNGALGLLPLGLLPTAPAQAQKGDHPFAEYKQVPWLARTHAVTMVPAAAALMTLRGLPPGSPKRERLIAFGDPYFSTEQAQEAAAESSAKPQQVATRGVPLVRRNSPQTSGVDSAELGLLPRLPDTADEVRSIAIALQADPSKVLHLGKAANEKSVKTMDLSKYRIVAFATHGLVPGELNGLTQPALALTAPEVADVDGDGLLTMEEILALKLDADWVVLSACNTGTGAGAGAEAASGLGRAFFYAGTRALLVTNWSVHSVSARELVTDLFSRQSANPKLARGEALRQAMMALVEDGGFKDGGGKVVFSYAHPLFWAPYTIIGDGGS